MPKRYRNSLPVPNPRRLLFGSVVLPSININIIHVNEHWVIIDKPAGILSVPGRHNRESLSVSEQVESHFNLLRDITVVHRLDLPTSGLMVFARHKKALKSLQALFAQRQVQKCYTALISRAITKKQGNIYLPLRLDPYQRPLQVYDPVHGKPCHTFWEKIAVENQHTRVFLYPRTGRTHQLRVHMAHPLGMNAAIKGDTLYHPYAPLPGTSKERLCLHASHLSFQDPFSGEFVYFESMAPF